MSEGARALGPAYKFRGTPFIYNYADGKYYYPGDTLTAKPGDTLMVGATVENINNISGTACFGVVWGGYYRCGPKTKHIDAGGVEPMPGCVFSMPSTDEDAVLHCGSYENGTCYSHDWTDAIHLRVQATPTPTPTPTPKAELLYTTETYQIVRTEEATLLDTTETYQIVRTEEEELLYTTQTYQIKRAEEANLLDTTETYQIERSEEEGLLYTTQTYQIERQLSVIECLFIRLSTGKPFPRIAQQNPIPRVTCIAEAIKAIWGEVNYSPTSR
mgnify:CR=1 FL=1